MDRFPRNLVGRLGDLHSNLIKCATGPDISVDPDYNIYIANIFVGGRIVLQ